MTPPPRTACRELRLREYRNFPELDLEFPAEGVAIIGDNGEGKTNLIEAIYYLEIFRSFRGAPDAQLVRKGAETFFVRGTFDRYEDDEVTDTTEIEVGYERRSQRKRVAVDQIVPERIGDAIGGVGAVVFSPSDMALITGAPGERRRFLDIVLSLSSPGYFGALQRYRQILRQRNALLRDGAPLELLESWDEGLIESGSTLIAARAGWVREHELGFTRRYARIAAGIRGKITYLPSVGTRGEETPEAMTEIEEIFRLELDRLAQRERERGMTLVGPHRDDLAFSIERHEDASPEDWIELREFGSGGQQRTAAIALRMVEAETIRRARGRDPVVLLDDIFAELDPGRSHRILELLEEEERGQVILTAPKASDLEVRRGSLPHWRLAGGEIYQ